MVESAFSKTAPFKLPTFWRGRGSPKKKFVLVTELWDDLVSKPEDIAITAEQISEVDKRLEEYFKNPNLGATWEDVKARILGQRR